MQEPLAGRGLAPGRWGARREKKALAAGGAGALREVQVQQALLRAWGAVAVAPVHYAKKDRRGENVSGDSPQGGRGEGSRQGTVRDTAASSPRSLNPCCTRGTEIPYLIAVTTSGIRGKIPPHSDAGAELPWLNDRYPNTERSRRTDTLAGAGNTGEPGGQAPASWSFPSTTLVLVTGHSCDEAHDTCWGRAAQQAGPRQVTEQVLIKHPPPLF